MSVVVVAGGKLNHIVVSLSVTGHHTPRSPSGNPAKQGPGQESDERPGGAEESVAEGGDHEGGAGGECSRPPRSRHPAHRPGHGAQPRPHLEAGQGAGRGGVEGEAGRGGEQQHQGEQGELGEDWGGHLSLLAVNTRLRLQSAPAIKIRPDRPRTTGGSDRHQSDLEISRYDTTTNTQHLTPHSSIKMRK